MNNLPPSHWQWDRLIGSCVIRLLIDLTIVSLLYFVAGQIGSPIQRDAITLFTVVYLPASMLVITAETLFAERNRMLAFGTFPLGMEHATSTVNPNFDIWPGLFWRGVLISMVMAGLLWWLVQQIPTNWFWLVMMLVAIFACSLTGMLILIRNHGLPYLSGYLKQYAQGSQPASAEQSDERVFGAYLLPWGVVAAALCGLISHQFFSGTAYPDSSAIPFSNVVYSVAGTVYVVAMWVCHACKHQVIGDVRCGLVHVAEDDQVKEADMYFLLHAAAGMVTGGGMVITRLFAIQHIPLWLVVVLEVILGAAAAVGGALLGIARGAALATPMNTGATTSSATAAIK
ncbi:hypothetical protein [Chitinivorax sp. B]|uniref:hypothetical protein n=1 Tax=Chitinivorax sp. B TaxID=2502235 RepID=UPI0010FA0845|nr:hypothetical protein [Chitinivorax sp. B]